MRPSNSFYPAGMCSGLKVLFKDPQVQICTICCVQANLCDPWDGRSWAALALNSFREGRQKDALQALKRALELHDLAAAASLWSSTLGVRGG